MIEKDFPVTPSEMTVALMSSATSSGKNVTIENFTISREGDNSKFFGYGICQKLTANIIELDKSLVWDYVKISAMDGSSSFSAYPYFYPSEINQNEEENITTITAYDALYDLSKHTISELNLTPPYSLYDVALAIGNFINGRGFYAHFNLPSLTYTDGANFNGDETLREVLDAIAEVTQSIYYLNWYTTTGSMDCLTFKRLDRDGEPVLTIGRDTYFDFTTKTNRRLSAIRSTSDLDETGLEASTGETGTTQYVRSNPFWDNRTDLSTLLEDAIAAIGGLTINQFHCEWEGNCLLEIGDKISIEMEDGSLVTTYLLDDTITYDGFFNEISQWEYSDSPSETLSNPTSIGEKINETYARVDKVNKRVDIVIGDVAENTSTITKIQADLEGIDLKIENSIDKALEEYVPNVDGLDDLKQTVATHTEKISGIEIDIDGIKSDVSENTSSITTLQDNTGNLTDRVTVTENNISSLEQTTESISASVATTKTELREEFNEDLGEMENQITTLSNEVSLKMSSEDVTIAINKSLENGVDKVTTTENKFTFNDSGLTISKSDSDISTTITEDGMTISRNSSEVLVADNQGVKAEDLHATTYLIIGDNSRFEDQGNRTACFWLST